MNVSLREDQIKTLITVIDHARNRALGSSAISYGIDALCRKDCADRWWELRKLLAGYVGDEKKVAAK